MLPLIRVVSPDVWLASTVGTSSLAGGGRRVVNDARRFAAGTVEDGRGALILGVGTRRLAVGGAQLARNPRYLTAFTGDLPGEARRVGARRRGCTTIAYWCGAGCRGLTDEKERGVIRRGASTDRRVAIVSGRHMARSGAPATQCAHANRSLVDHALQRPSGIAHQVDADRMARRAGVRCRAARRDYGAVA